MYGKLKRHINKMSQPEIETIESSINAYISTNSPPWFVKYFQRLIEEIHSKIYSKHKTRKIMIEDARLSYKKINSRPLSYSSSIIHNAWILFSVNFAKALKPNTLILNIDESTIGRDCRIDHSWTNVRISKEWQILSSLVL